MTSREVAKTLCVAHQRPALIVSSAATQAVLEQITLALQDADSEYLGHQVEVNLYVYAELLYKMSKEHNQSKMRAQCEFDVLIMSLKEFSGASLSDQSLCPFDETSRAIINDWLHTASDIFNHG